MGVIEELQNGHRRRGCIGGRVDRRHRLPAARIRRRRRRRSRRHQCPQHSRRRGHRDVRRRTVHPRHACRRRRRRRPRRHQRGHGRSASPSNGRTATALGVGTVVFGAAASPSGGTRVTVGTVSAVARAFRGPGRPAHRRQRRAHRAARAGLVGRCPARHAGRLLGINTNRLGEGFYLALPADERAARSHRAPRPRRVD